MNTESLASRAKTTMERLDYDREAAVKQLVAAARRNDLLREQLLEAGAWATVRGVIHTTRRGIKAVPAGADNVVGLRAMARRTLMNWPLRDGTRLRDATRTKVEAAAVEYDRNRAASATGARFMYAVRDLLPQDNQTTVAKVATEEQLALLYQEAKHAES